MALFRGAAQRALTSGLMAIALVLAAWPAGATPPAALALAGTTFTVTTADDLDSGSCGTVCSLRDAINAANGNVGDDTIVFAIPDTGSVVPVIRLAQPLPSVYGKALIDGTSQPGAAAVAIDGTLTSESGIVLDGDGSEVRGLSLGGFTRSGRAALVLDGSGHHTVVGSTIGVDATATTATPNWLGMLVTTPGNVIGRPGAGNVIAANTNHGIQIGRGENPTADTGGNVVQGNLIGVTPTSSTGMGNAFDGIEINGGDGNLVGGAPGAGNVISGNAVGVLVAGTNASNTRLVGNLIGTTPDGTAAAPNQVGIVLSSPGFGTHIGEVGMGNVLSGNAYYGVQVDREAAGTTVVANMIGTDPSGLVAIPNGQAGVLLTGSSVVVGGDDPSDANLISGNVSAGVWLTTPEATGNQIVGNIIGPDASGTAMGNGVGVFVQQGPNGNLVRENVIAFNLEDGVRVTFDSAVRTSLERNRIHDNAGIGIDLDWNGPTENDPDDADSGPNNLQNKPVLTSATSTASAGNVSGTLDAAPGSGSAVIELFFNQACDESGFGEGEAPLRTVVQALDPSGDAAFSISTPPLPPGAWITATATVGGNTSEFSACVEATPVAGESTVAEVTAGGTIGTDLENDGATPADPIETSVTTSAGAAGTVRITESPGPALSGYTLLAMQVDIEAPPGSVTQPITIAFTIDSSALPAGMDETTVQLLRDGIPIADCATGDGTATPDPCIARRQRVGDDVVLTVRTSHASLWQAVAVDGYAFSGFFQPVDNQPTLNRVAAGQSVPVKFRLGGDRGLLVLASGYPKVSVIACSNSAGDPLEETAGSAPGGLRYDPATQTYTFIWKTSKRWADSCRRLTFRFNDGTTRSADFRFGR